MSRAPRLHCACSHVFTPDGRLVAGVMHTVCRACRRVVVSAVVGQRTLTVSLWPDDAAVLVTVADVVRAVQASKGAA